MEPADTMRSTLVRALALLKRLEWSGLDTRQGEWCEHRDACPCCRGLPTIEGHTGMPERTGHAPDCELKALIGCGA